MNYFNKRNGALISLAAFVWSIYFAIQGQFLNDYLIDLTTFSPVKISLLVSLISLTGAIASIFAGSINDNLRIKFGRRKLFIFVGGSISAIFLFLLPLNQSLLFILAINILMNLFNTTAFVCNNSLIPDISTEKTLGKTNAIASFGTSLGTIVGFAIMLISPSSNVFFVAGSICVVGFLVVGIFFQEPLPTEQPKNWFKELKESFLLKKITHEKDFYKFLLSHFLLHMGINTYIPFLLIFLTQKNDILSDQLIGLGLSIQKGEILIVFAVMTIISLLITIPIGLILDRLNKELFLILSRILFVLSTAILGITPFILNVNPLIVAILFIIPFSLTNTADIISRGAVMHSLVPEKKRGQLLGLLFFTKTIARIPGAIIGGVVAQNLQRGYQYNFFIGAFIIMLSIIFLIPNSTLQSAKITQKKIQKQIS